jgi:NADH-quinone oxidoreductase subunit L
MESATHLLPVLLGMAVLAPLASFWAILAFGSKMGKGGEIAAYVATGAISVSLLLSLVALGIWISSHGVGVAHHPEASGPAHDNADQTSSATSHEGEHDNHHDPRPSVYTGNWYTLAEFPRDGKLRLTIDYYIDALTICMFAMVTLVSTCIHFYSIGYMHEELHKVTDHEVTRRDGSPLQRRGRYHVFFQYLSLFCFSMLGLVVSGNLAMTFVFWELVGICSYFLIGFYLERKSASNAANKAFVVNRIGDFGMIIGLMAIWASLGTFAYGDIEGEHGLFSLVRPGPDAHPLGRAHAYQLVVPDEMVKLAAADEVAALVRAAPPGATETSIEDAIKERIPQWRDPAQSSTRGGLGYGLLIVAGIGVFCGCVGKSAQFPLHTWLPDAMEGPTPVSALVHSATMVAAGVYLVARFYPVFTPEVLLVIAIVGCVTLFMAATIAITATDIKRVLAYSTVSQLGYMMMALGLGGWLAGVLHLITHAFFKSLLFLCSGSVIHAVHTNEMPLMGGLRKKMPWTAYTMLVGCLAIAGAGIPLVIGPSGIGLSGYYSKDAILEQAMSFMNANATWGPLFFYTAAGGAAITAFYMFRLWYMTFAGSPRDQHRFRHAHESPAVMVVPLVILAVFAVGVAWPALNLSHLLEQARPAGTAAKAPGVLVEMTWPNEHDAHTQAIVVPATLIAFVTALAGFLLATVFYGWRVLSADEARRYFQPIYRFLWNKWWFDELYDFLFVRPTLAICRFAAATDRRLIDGIVDGLAWSTRKFADMWDWVADRIIVDGFVNWFADTTYRLGLMLREIQTGKIRQYVMFIVVGTVGVFVLITRAYELITRRMGL